MVPDSSPHSDPRRKAPRVPAFLVVELSSKAKPGRCGVTRNASGKGLLIVTPSRFAVGDEVDVALHAGGQSDRACGRVVRVEENAPDSPEVWRYRLAVEIEGQFSEDILEVARARSPLGKTGTG